MLLDEVDHSEDDQGHAIREEGSNDEKDQGLCYLLLIGRDEGSHDGVLAIVFVYLPSFEGSVVDCLGLFFLTKLVVHLGLEVLDIATIDNLVHP
jgi:hypothetical protein